MPDVPSLGQHCSPKANTPELVGAGWSLSSQHGVPQAEQGCLMLGIVGWWHFSTPCGALCRLLIIRYVCSQTRGENALLKAVIVPESK